MRYGSFAVAAAAFAFTGSALAEEAGLPPASSSEAATEAGAQAQSVPAMVYQKIGQAKCSRFGRHRRVVWKMPAAAVEAKANSVSEGAEAPSQTK